MNLTVSTWVGDKPLPTRFTKLPADVSAGTKAHWDPLSLLIDVDEIQALFEKIGYYEYVSPTNPTPGFKPCKLSKPLKRSNEEARQEWAKYEASYGQI